MLIGSLNKTFPSFLPVLWGAVASSSEGGKEIFCLTIHSKQMFLQLYGVGHMVKDVSVSQRGNLLLPLHGQLFPISSKGSFISTIPHTGQHILQTSYGALTGTRNGSMVSP